MQTKFIKVVFEEKIIHIYLQRPEVKNAFHPEMISELTKLFLEIKAKANAASSSATPSAPSASASTAASQRLVIIRGAGPVFCSGADLNWMKESVKYTFEENYKDASSLYDMFQAISDCPLPVMSLVQGSVFGGALGFLATSDYVIADPKTKFCFSEVKLGIIPAVISSFLISKIPYGQILPYMISGRIFTAEVALRMGLIHEILDENESFENPKSSETKGDPKGVYLQNRIQSFLESGPEAVKKTKALLRSLLTLDEKEKREKTIQAIAAQRISAEGQKGLQAFLEKKGKVFL